MSNPEEPKAPQYTIRWLHWWIAVAVGCCLPIAVLVKLRQGFKTDLGVLNREDWPKPMRSLAEELEVPEKSISVRGGVVLLNKKSIVLVEKQTEFIQLFVSQQSLEATDGYHPCADALKQAIVDGWPVPENSRVQWFATPGYGYTHLEGQDLFLVCWDQGSSTAWILHQNIF